MADLDNYDRTPILVSALADAINGSYTYNYNSLFCAFANPGYRDYLYRYIYREGQWLDGYVSSFHNSRSGIVSTRLANAIITGLARQISGSPLSYKPSDSTAGRDEIDYISHKWSPVSNIDSAKETATAYMLAFGTCLMKVNSSLDGTLWVDSVRMDQCYYQTDFRGRVCEATFFIRSYVDTQHKDMNYFLVEKRYFLTRRETEKTRLMGKSYSFVREDSPIPVSEIQVHVYNGMVNNNMMPQAANAKKGIDWCQIPRWLKDKIASDYSAVRVNEPRPLRFADSLGVECVTNGQDYSVPSLRVGVSILKNCESELIAYDYAFSKYLEAIYQGSGRVAIPKELSLSDSKNGGAYTGLDKSIYEMLPGTDPQAVKPIVTQFELRAEEWKSIMDNILRTVATKIGMSPKVIASYLSVQLTQKTATEVGSDDDSSIAYIHSVQAKIKPHLDSIIELVLNQNGMPGNVECQFGESSLLDVDRVIERAKVLLEAHLIDTRGAMKMVFPDEDSEQIEKRLADAKAEKDASESFDPLKAVQAPDVGQEKGPLTDADGMVVEGSEDADQGE